VATTAPRTGDPAAAVDQRPSTTRRAWWRLPWSTAAASVLVAGVVLTGALAGLAAAVNQRQEARLLHEQVHEASSILGAVAPTTEIPLASAGELAVVTHGNARLFATYFRDRATAPIQFSSVTLWRMTAVGPLQAARVGSAPRLPTQPAPFDRFLAAAGRRAGLHVLGVFSGPHPRLGYAYAPPGQHTWVVYAESTVVPGRVELATSSRFANLALALYLGRTARVSALLATLAGHLPLPGPVARVVVPFGSSALTLEAAPTTELTGALSADLPWIVIGAGALVTGGAFAATEVLVRRRRRAQVLAEENRRLYQEQRRIALSLQEAILPGRLPRIAGMEIAARYVAGSVEAEIGGDWYDVVEQSGGRLLFSVGDVSGRGIRAATVMARLHFAIGAHATSGDGPGEILHKLSNQLDLTTDDHFATVLCGSVDVVGHTLTLASAGHLPPILVAGDHRSFVAAPVGPPIGVVAGARYGTVTIDVPPGALFLAFTDGLVEEPVTGVAAGLERLARDVEVGDRSLDEFLDAMVEKVTGTGPTDDTVVLAMRWTGDWSMAASGAESLHASVAPNAEG